MRHLFLHTSLLLSLSACSLVLQPSAKELQALDHPPSAVQAKLAPLLPAAVAWYAQTEQQFAPQGRGLTAQEQTIAQKLGVKHPEQVRVVVTRDFPLPQDAVLRKVAESYGMGSPFAGGFTLGHTILLKPDYAKEKYMLTHELVHVSQVERMGREAFVKRYLTEMEMLGYARSPLELEAYSKQNLRIHE